MEQKDITTLIEKYIAGNASQEEEDLLLQWYRSIANNAAEVEISRKDEPEHIRERILLKLQEHIHEPKQPVIRKLNTWKRIAIAASFVLIISIVAYLWLQKQTPVEVVNTPVQTQDIRPGTNKATLTLADGSVIDLNNAATGGLTQQGNTKIIKQDSGQLAYNITSYETIKMPQYNVLSTPRGGQYKIVLPDGSKVWLNAASSLKFPVAFTGKERLVELTGEGYFEVAKNAAQPFKVMTEGITVEALGTQFNIMSYRDEPFINTTLLEGSVKVTSANISNILRPAQQAQLNRTGNMQVVYNLDTAATVAWKNGYFNFKGMDIKTIMQQIGRWYDVDITFSGEPTEDKYSGKINRNTKLFEVLDLLKSGGVDFTIEGNTIQVKP